MTLEHWLAIPLAIAVSSFIYFAFCQGFKVKPDPDRGNGPSFIGGADGWTHL